MWLGTNKGFYSIAKVPTQFLSGRGDNKVGEDYTVRSRDKSYLETQFPEKRVFEYPFSDYQYRVYATRQELNKFLLDKLDEVTYDNFKNSVTEHKLHYFYMKVWEIGVNILSSAKL